RRSHHRPGGGRPRRRADRRVRGAPRRAVAGGRLHGSHRGRWAVRAATVRNEFAKMRHLRVGLLAAVLAIGVFVVTAATGLTNPSFDTATPDSWNALLGSMASGVGLVAPLVLAVLASRQVDVEHRGSGWLLAATAGVTGGQLCRAKLVTLAIVVTAATVAAS